MLIYGETPIPKNRNERSRKLKEDSKDFIVPIRMNFKEKEKIKKRADIAGKKFSTFMRDSALRL